MKLFFNLTRQKIMLFLIFFVFALNFVLLCVLYKNTISSFFSSTVSQLDNLLVTAVCPVKYIVPSITPRNPSVLTTSPTPKPLLSKIPWNTLLPASFTQTSWNFYSSETLGVSFSYPTDPRIKRAIQGPSGPPPVLLEDKRNNSVGIGYGYADMFTITMIPTTLPLLDWLKSNNILTDKYSDFYQTTFDTFPAVLAIERPELNAQEFTNIYYVKPNAKRLYKIEYAIPFTVTAEVPDANHTPDQVHFYYQSAYEQNDVFSTYIPQMLGSVKFM